MLTPDRDLVQNLKDHRDVEQSLQELVNRHSGIYFEIINQYVPDNSIYCDKQELFNDKELYIYNAALKYNPNKGTKFSTFLGNETKWVCLNTYNKAKKKPTFSKTNEDLDLIKGLDCLHDTSSNQTFVKEVYEMVEKHPDKRVGKIFKMRYNDGENNKVMPWKLIAPHVDLSIQGCINVHNAVIKDLKRKLKTEKEYE